MDKRLLQILLNYLNQKKPEPNLAIANEGADEVMFDDYPQFKKNGDYWVISKAEALQLVRDELGVVENKDKLKDYEWQPEL